MTYEFRHCRVRHWARLIPIIWICLPASGQGPDPAETFQSLKKHFLEYQVGGCGGVILQEQLARSLVQAGTKALPLIEDEFKLTSAKGSYLGFVSTWLEPIYAKILGPSAFSLLKHRELPTGESTERRNVDSALAISLGITSYVSNTRPMNREISCLGDVGPRIALDRLILGWLQADRQWFESALGPSSLDSLSRLLSHRQWEAFHASQMKGAPAFYAIGYSLGAKDNRILSERTPQLGGTEPAGEARTDLSPLVIETTFFESNGVRCGSMPVTFSRAEGDLWLRYRVDTKEIGPLLRLLTSCAGASQ